jgi:hypothetical protein
MWTSGFQHKVVQPKASSDHCRIQRGIGLSEVVNHTSFEVDLPGFVWSVLVPNSERIDVRLRYNGAYSGSSDLQNNQSLIRSEAGRGVLV